MLKPTQNTDLPGLRTSILITKPPATKVIPMKVAVTRAVSVTKTATMVCVVSIAQTSDSHFLSFLMITLAYSLQEETRRSEQGPSSVPVDVLLDTDIVS